MASRIGSPYSPVLGVLVGVLLAAPAWAGDKNPRDRVFKMDISNGFTHRVRYFGDALSPGESTTLSELERLENTRAYARDLLAAKEQYVTTERILEPHRRYVQRMLYGLNVTGSSYGMMSGGGYGGGLGYYPRVAASSYWAGYGYGGYGGWGAGGYTAARQRTVNASLANGVGEEGVMKDMIARTIAQEATPEFAASLDRAYQEVSLRASASPTLRVALKMPTLEASRKERNRIRAVAAEDGVVLTLKSGQKIHGTKMRETKDWYIVDMDGGRQTRVRPGEVVQVDVSDKSKVTGAAGAADE